MTAIQATPLLQVLDRAHVPYELLPHARTQTAVAEARTLGLPGWQVAKTLVLAAPDGFTRVVVPASERLDFRKLREVMGTRDLHLATEADLAREYPEFEVGAVPPVGGRHHDDVLIDRRICECESVVLEAGSHEESLRLRTADLLTVADAKLADVCQD